MTKKEFKAFVNEALEDGAVWFRTNEEEEPGGILYFEDDELVFNFIDACEDWRYCPEDYDDTKSLLDEIWKELDPQEWEQIDEEEYDEVEKEYFNS